MSKEIMNGMEMNEIHKFLVYTDTVNILGENINTIRNNTGALLQTSRKVGLEVNTEKTYDCVSSPKCKRKPQFIDCK
jgi:hypothetical protein